MSVANELAAGWLICGALNDILKGRSAKVEIKTIQNEIHSEALKEVAAGVIDTLHRIEQGELNYMDANSRLRAYKSIIQIIALERLRPATTPIGMIEHFTK